MQQGEIILYQPDETVRLEVRLEDDTVWLTTSQMAELFNREESNIRRHIINVFNEGELDRENNVQNLHVNGIKKPVPFYTLDVIISVGYRVKSLNGTKFRRWANAVLKQYMLKGYAANSRLTALEQKVSEQGTLLKEVQDKVDFFVRTSLPPVEGIFYDGQIFDAYKQIVSLIRQARQCLVLIDNYIDETTLTMLSKRDADVAATIYTRPLTQQQQLDLERHPTISARCGEYLSAQPRPFPHHRRHGLSLRSQPQGRRQEILCIHQDARDLTSATVERDKITKRLRTVRTKRIKLQDMMNDMTHTMKRHTDNGSTLLSLFRQGGVKTLVMMLLMLMTAGVGYFT